MTNKKRDELIKQIKKMGGDPTIAMVVAAQLIALAPNMKIIRFKMGEREIVVKVDEVFK